MKRHPRHRNWSIWRVKTFVWRTRTPDTVVPFASSRSSNGKGQCQLCCWICTMWLKTDGRMFLEIFIFWEIQRFRNVSLNKKLQCFIFKHFYCLLITSIHFSIESRRSWCLNRMHVSLADALIEKLGLDLLESFTSYDSVVLMARWNRSHDGLHFVVQTFVLSFRFPFSCFPAGFGGRHGTKEYHILEAGRTSNGINQNSKNNLPRNSSLAGRSQWDFPAA